MTPAPVPASCVQDAWSLTRRISPRPVVRGAAVDEQGRPVNAYPRLRPVNGRPPSTPWAIHLADDTGRYRLLCADLDARTNPRAAAADARRLAGLLDGLGVTHLICESGPTGGRHVWIGLVDSVDAVGVAALARLLKAWLPTLDLAPLVNPASGCVRPPGAPHRLGGTSRVISGNLSVLTRPATTAEQVNRLVTLLAARVEATAPVARSGRRLVANEGGMPFLPGPRRDLSPACRELVFRDGDGDRSAVLWRILCSAAVAHWRYPDVEALVDAPGLEHARTTCSGAIRTARPPAGPASPRAVLRRQWCRAVKAMATMTPAAGRLGDDATFDARALRVTELVRAVQARADGAPDRWGASRRGVAQRRVLDALCLFHLQAVRTDGVEADIRRVGLTCGVDRETARRGLIALAADGWIARTGAASGRRGAVWTINPAGAIHPHLDRVLSQADPRPTGTGPALRSLLERDLAGRLQTGAHDAFAPSGGLGIEAGHLYSRLAEPLSAIACARLMGRTLDEATKTLERLVTVGLVVRRASGWERTDAAQLDRAAVDQHTLGRHQQRAERYALERALWSWWQAELETRRAARIAKRTRTRRWVTARPVDGGLWPPHPRRCCGRADFAAARRLIVQGGHLGRRPSRVTPRRRQADGHEGDCPSSGTHEQRMTPSALTVCELPPGHRQTGHEPWRSHPESSAESF